MGNFSDQRSNRLNKDQLIDGKFLRSGFHNTLRGVAHREITSRGRKHLGVIRLSFEESLREDEGLDAVTELKDRRQFEIAWISAVMWLKAAGVIASIDQLEFRLHDKSLRIVFRGKRRKKFADALFMKSP